MLWWTYFVNMPRVISLSQTRRQMIISNMDFYKRVNTRKELFGRKKRSTPFIIYTNFSMDRMRKLSETENIFPTKRFLSLCCNVCCWADADGSLAQTAGLRTYYHHNATSLHQEYNALNLNSLLESLSFPRTKMKLLYYFLFCLILNVQSNLAFIWNQSALDK